MSKTEIAGTYKIVKRGDLFRVLLKVSSTMEWWVPVGLHCKTRESAEKIAYKNL